LFSASGRFNFAQDAKVQAHSLTLMVSATLRKSFQQIDAPVLTTDAASLVSAGKLDVFAERYGDRFVRGAYLGGLFFGIFRIETKDEMSRQNVDTALAGSYGLFSADINVKVS